MHVSRSVLVGAAAAIALAAGALVLQLQGGLVPDPSPGASSNASLAREIGADGGQWYQYESDRFAGDLRARRTVLVAVHAEWCTDCMVQAPIMSRLLKDPAFKDAVGYVVDFDRERKFLFDHKVRSQSTFIVFKDGREVARSTADTNEQRIRELFLRGL